MRFVERCILKLLVDKAADQGFAVEAIFAEVDGYENSEKREPVRWGGLSLSQLIEHVDAWDTNHGLEFVRKGSDASKFWIFIVPGNGEDLIFDYTDSSVAKEIVSAVYREIYI